MSKSTTKTESTKTETVQAANLVLRPEVTEIIAAFWLKNPMIHRHGDTGCAANDKGLQGALAEGKDITADRKWAEKALASGEHKFCKRCAVITPAKAEAMVAKRAAKEAARREGAKVPSMEHGTIKVGKNRTEYDAMRNTETGEVKYTDSKGEEVIASKTATKTFKGLLAETA